MKLLLFSDIVDNLDVFVDPEKVIAIRPCLETGTELLLEGGVSVMVLENPAEAASRIEKRLAGEPDKPPTKRRRGRPSLGRRYSESD